MGSLRIYKNRGDWGDKVLVRGIRGHFKSQIAMIMDVSGAADHMLYVCILDVTTSHTQANRILSFNMVNCIKSGIRNSLNVNT